MSGQQQSNDRDRYTGFLYEPWSAPLLLEKRLVVRLRAELDGFAQHLLTGGIGVHDRLPPHVSQQMRQADEPEAHMTHQHGRLVLTSLVVVFEPANHSAENVHLRLALQRTVLDVVLEGVSRQLQKFVL